MQFHRYALEIKANMEKERAREAEEKRAHEASGTSDLCDLKFVARKNASRQRVEGKLYVFQSGRAYSAFSGSRTLLPLPNGAYKAHTLRLRKKESMQRDVPAAEHDGLGMCFPGWSVNIDPRFSTKRTLLRIHPDGNLPGTMGCIGILERMDQCYDDLFHAFRSAQTLELVVEHNNTDKRVIGV